MHPYPMTAAVATHCPYCALQCGMALTPADEGVVVDERAGGGLCRKGWTAGTLLDPALRLTTPLVRDRKGGPLRAAGWDEALDRAAAGLRAAQRAGGADGVAVFGGGGLTNEKAYLVGKFARVALGTSRVDYNGRWCMSSAAAAANRAFGLDRGLPFPLEDLDTAGCITLVGANPAETMPPVMRRIAAARAAGGALVVIDPRRTATAEVADLHLQPRPGSDLALALGLLFLAGELSLLDRDYLVARTTGFADLQRVVAGYWPGRVERLTGVGEQQLRAAVALIGAGRGTYLLTARGAEQHSKGVDTVGAWIGLALGLGLPGRVGSGWGTITGQGNGQGGREHGQKSDQLPGYRRLDDPAAREHVARVWGIDPADLPGPGPSATELLAMLGEPGGPRAMLLLGSNPVVSAPRAGRVTARLDALDCLVVADVVLSETAAAADVVLPVAQWAEEEGTTTDLTGRVLRRRRAVPSPAGVRTDLQVLAGLAARLGRDAGFPTDPAEVFAELARASAGGPADYAGLSYERLDREGPLHWPCPATDDPELPHPGTPRLFLDRFATPDGLARVPLVEHRPAAEEPDATYPVQLTTGRVAMQYQSGAQTRRIAALTEAAPAPFVQLHPHLAQRVGVVDGQSVRVETRRGSIEVTAAVTDAIREDTIFVPFHWAGAQRANLLTIDALDPVSRMPEFKTCAARVVPA